MIKATENIRVNCKDGIGYPQNHYELSSAPPMDGLNAFESFHEYNRLNTPLPCLDQNGNKAKDGTHDCEIIKQYYYHYKWLTAHKNDIISGQDTRQAYQIKTPEKVDRADYLVKKIFGDKKLPEKENGKGETDNPVDEFVKTEIDRLNCVVLGDMTQKYLDRLYLSMLKAVQFGQRLQQPGKVDKDFSRDDVYNIASEAWTQGYDVCDMEKDVNPSEEIEKIINNVYSINEVDNSLNADNQTVKASENLIDKAKVIEMLEGKKYKLPISAYQEIIDQINAL